MAEYVPEGFQRITPYLIIEEADGFIAFAQAAFGAQPRMLHRRPDGRLMHGELDMLGAVIELGTPTGDYTPTRVALHVYVPDPDAVYAQALAAGAKALYPPTAHDYGERSGGVEDAWGNQWYIAQVIDAQRRQQP